jgi:hypothetical protein
MHPGRSAPVAQAFVPRGVRTGNTRKKPVKELGEWLPDQINLKFGRTGWMKNQPTSSVGLAMVIPGEMPI